MNPAIFDKPFFEVTLPLMLTIISGGWAMISTNNKRLEDMNKRLDDVIHRLGRIEDLLADHSQRIVRLEERNSPFARH